MLVAIVVILARKMKKRPGQPAVKAIDRPTRARAVPYALFGICDKRARKFSHVSRNRFATQFAWGRRVGLPASLVADSRPGFRRSRVQTEQRRMLPA